MGERINRKSDERSLREPGNWPKQAKQNKDRIIPFKGIREGKISVSQRPKNSGLPPKAKM